MVQLDKEPKGRILSEAQLKHGGSVLKNNVKYSPGMECRGKIHMKGLALINVFHRVFLHFSILH